MDTMSSSSSLTASHGHGPSTYDELSMHQSLLFSDSLRDLKHLRTQLYSAAEYFEVSYTNDDQKETVVNTLKDYTVKALVNTVDHLGSISFKVTDLMDEKADEVSGTELRVSCIQQRLRTCQECIDHEGLSQQSFVMITPKYHKRYTLPGRKNEHSSDGTTESNFNGFSLDNADEWNQLKSAVRTSIRGSQTSTRRKGRAPSPLQSSRSANNSFPDKQKLLEKRSASPLRSKFPLLRSGSVSSRSKTPNPSRPTTPNLSNTRPRYPSEPRKSSSLRLRAEPDNQHDSENHSSKSKRLLKALLSRGKSRKDEKLYTFLDEY